MAMIKTPKIISQSLSRRPKSPFLQVQGKDVLSPAASLDVGSAVGVIDGAFGTSNTFDSGSGAGGAFPQYIMVSAE